MIDAIMARWATDPNLHVYHYGGYEPGAVKRLMGRHATREAEVDRLLRAGRFVDLHAIVKQSLRASVEEYSIKQLEPLYGFERRQPLEQASAALRVIQRGLELGAVIAANDEHATIVAAYIREDSSLRLPGPEGRSLGRVVAIDLIARTVDIGKSGAQVHPTSVFEHETYGSTEQAESLMRFGEWVAGHGVDAPGAYRAARDLLLGRGPRLAGHAGGPLEAPGEGGVRAARRLVLRLDRGALAVQGPPGSGKTFTGARMICDLVRKGKCVGVCAQSHKVIANLLSEVLKAAHEERVAVRCLRKVTEKSPTPEPGIAESTDNGAVRSALRTREATVVGGTAFMWAREEFFAAVDVLFVDEAGQMSLANVLAIAPCAKSLVLLGDPRQLEQPVQGSHPEGTAVSALEHVLEGAQTIADDRGLFLEETWRLPPAICGLTSELFYERRLLSRAGLERQALLGDVPFAGSGFWFIPVEHDANQGASPEEVEIVGELVRTLMGGGVRWRDRDG